MASDDVKIKAIGDDGFRLIYIDGAGHRQVVDLYLRESETRPHFSVLGSVMVFLRSLLMEIDRSRESVTAVRAERAAALAALQRVTDLCDEYDTSCIWTPDVRAAVAVPTGGNTNE
jgi:hypothetical protein